MAFVVQVFMP